MFRMLSKSGQIFLPFCHNPRVWQPVRQTDTFLIASPRWHSMQRGANCTLPSALSTPFLACFASRKKTSKQTGHQLEKDFVCAFGGLKVWMRNPADVTSSASCQQGVSDSCSSSSWTVITGQAWRVMTWRQRACSLGGRRIADRLDDVDASIKRTTRARQASFHTRFRFRPVVRLSFMLHFYLPLGDCDKTHHAAVMSLSTPHPPTCL